MDINVKEFFKYYLTHIHYIIALLIGSVIITLILFFILNMFNIKLQPYFSIISWLIFFVLLILNYLFNKEGNVFTIELNDDDEYYTNALGYYENKKTGKLKHYEVLEAEGIKLNKWNRVHHIDKNKKNNSLDNLYICKNQNEHSWIHKSNRKVKSNVNIWKERN
jgi:hypothetical protein